MRKAVGALVLVCLIGMVVSMLLGFPIAAPAFLIGMVLLFGVWELLEKRERGAGGSRTSGGRHKE